jgi:hypothetical protein
MRRSKAAAGVAELECDGLQSRAADRAEQNQASTEVIDPGTGVITAT